MTDPQPYDNGGNIPKGGRVVSTFDEWTEWVASLEQWRDRRPPIAYATGELADAIRKRFGVDDNAPVRIGEQFNMTRMGLVAWIDCNHTDLPNHRDATFDVPRRNGYDWGAIRTWLEGGE
jgi:hypothetical protein